MLNEPLFWLSLESSKYSEAQFVAPLNKELAPLVCFVVKGVPGKGIILSFNLPHIESLGASMVAN